MTDERPAEATRERMSEDAAHASPADHLIYLFHIATYDFAVPHVAGREVLDLGCGTGYGTRRLAEHATRIVGVDVDRGAVEGARARYLAPAADAPSGTLEFAAIRPVEEEPLPFADDAFDTVVSFQVIEHVPSVGAYLAEVRRVLRPGGTFVCATPDRRWRLGARQRPYNLYHLDEWSPAQLEALLAPVFGTTETYGMTAPPEVIGIELARCRTARRVTLPFTFPGAPEWWRTGGLRAIERVRSRRRGSVSTTEPALAPPPSFTLDDIRIAPGVEPSANVITVSR